MELRNDIPKGSEPHSNIFLEIQEKLNELNEIPILSRCHYTRQHHLTTYSSFYDLTKQIDKLNLFTKEPQDIKEILFFYSTSNSAYDICTNIKIQTGKTGIYIIQDHETSYEKIEESFNKLTHLEGAEENLKINKNHFLKIFIADEHQFLIVFTNKKLPIQTLYKLKVLQWTLFKEIVTEFEPLTIDFYKALVDEDKTKLCEIINKIKTSPRITEIKIEKLKNLLNSRKNSKINELEYDISDLRSNIQNFRTSIANCIESIEDKSLQLEALKLTSESDIEEIKYIQKYLDKSPYIESYTLNDRSITLDYHAPLIYYDDYILDKIINNYDENGIYHRILNIFKNKKYELYTKCRIKFDIINFSVTQRNRDNFQPSDIEHPHIQRYNCFGNHTDALYEAALNSDYIGGLEQLTQAVLNLNFSDSVVLRELLLDLSHKMSSSCWKSKETGEFKTLNQIFEEDC